MSFTKMNVYGINKMGSLFITVSIPLSMLFENNIEINDKTKGNDIANHKSNFCFVNFLISKRKKESKTETPSNNEETK